MEPVQKAGRSRLDRLKAHWLASGVTPNRGTDAASVQAFEQRYNVTLPDDFKDYVHTLNGMDVDAPPSQGSRYRFAEKDNDGFCFWPLERVTRASEGEAPESFPDADTYFVFADHMDWSWAYAIRLSSDPNAATPVVIVGTMDGRPQELAASFGDFVEMYLRGYRHVWIRT